LVQESDADRGAIALTTVEEPARPGARLVEFAAGHNPFLSRPQAFAQSIATEIARS
jgi:pimeloyl-ACP methyl ester carboxylesterase